MSFTLGRYTQCVCDLDDTLNSINMWFVRRWNSCCLAICLIKFKNIILLDGGFLCFYLFGLLLVVAGFFLNPFIHVSLSYVFVLLKHINILLSIHFNFLSTGGLKSTQCFSLFLFCWIFPLYWDYGAVCSR